MKFIDKLEKNSFIITRYLSDQEREIKIDRFNNLPKDYIDFLNSFKSITNRTETVWFNSIEDFNSESENEFKWNEFETLSKEWCEDDKEELEIIEKFWSNHIPILISVKNGYEFLAINITEENYGKIYHGQEPEFENTSKYCDSFEELILKFENKEIREYWT